MMDRDKYFSLSAVDSPSVYCIPQLSFYIKYKYAKIYMFCEDSYYGKYTKFKNL